MDFSGKWDAVCLIDEKNDAVSFEITQFACNAWFLNYEPNFIYLNGVKEVYDTDNSSINKPYIGLSKFIATFDNSMALVKFEHIGILFRKNLLFGEL